MRKVRGLSVDRLQEMAGDAREAMTPAEIQHAAKVARANMRLCAKAKENWRRQCREELGDGGNVYAPQFASRAGSL